MAVYGANRVIANAAGATKLDPGLFHGKARCFVDRYVGTGAEAGATLTVAIGPELPVGAVILNVALRNQATGATIHVGDAVDTDRYINAGADNATTLISDVNTGLGNVIIATTVQLLLTLSGAVTLTTGLVYVVVEYACE
jgi:hypothetical protein